MRNIITYKFIFGLLITTLLATAPSAYALDLSGFLSNVQKTAKEAKEAIKAQIKRAEEAKKNAEANEEARRAKDLSEQNSIEENTPSSNEEVAITVVSNSILKMKGTAPQGTKWLLVSILKAGSNEKFNSDFFPISEDASYEFLVSLRAGPGNYVINLFVKDGISRYGDDYKYLSTHKVTNSDTRDLSYLLPTSMVQSENAQIKELAQRITKGASTEREVVTLIYEYVISTVKYNTKGYNDKSFLNDPYDALSILKKPVTVCAGFSNFFAALVRASGIRVKVINGPALLSPGVWEEHAWNEVFVDGKWELFDTTWGVDRDDNKYFFADPDDFALEHKKTKELDY